MTVESRADRSRPPRRKRQKRGHGLLESATKATQDGDPQAKLSRPGTESPSSRLSPTSDNDGQVIDATQRHPAIGTKEPVSFDQVSPDDPQAYVERISSVGFTQQVSQR